VKNSTVNFHTRKSGIEVNNYFGQGNNTVYDKTVDDDTYKVIHEEYLVNPSVTFRRNKKLRLNAGVMYKNFDVKKSDTIDFISGTVTTKPVNLLGVTGGIVYDRRDHPTAPFTGYYFSIGGGYFPGIFDKAHNFVKVIWDLRTYLGYKQNISLALRLRGEKVFIDYPFFESAFLGGSKLLRGFPSERLAGDGSLLGSAELRLKLFKMNFLLPETVGIFGFAETGRVFLEGEKSDLWRTGYGGGLFIFLINRDITLKLTYARSKEKDYAIYFGTGFGF
jgi:outer membrane protein assembly factor BamA